MPSTSYRSTPNSMVHGIGKEIEAQRGKAIAQGHTAEPGSALYHLFMLSELHY